MSPLAGAGTGPGAAPPRLLFPSWYSLNSQTGPHLKTFALLLSLPRICIPCRLASFRSPLTLRLHIDAFLDNPLQKQNNILLLLLLSTLPVLRVTGALARQCRGVSIWPGEPPGGPGLRKRVLIDCPCPSLPCRLAGAGGRKKIFRLSDVLKPLTDAQVEAMKLGAVKRILRAEKAVAYSGAAQVRPRPPSLSFHPSPQEPTSQQRAGPLVCCSPATPPSVTSVLLRKTEAIAAAPRRGQGGRSA